MSLTARLFRFSLIRESSRNALLQGSLTQASPWKGSFRLLASDGNKSDSVDSHSPEEQHKPTGDPFGTNSNDDDRRLGSSSELPPRYKRDSVTGRQTNEVEPVDTKSQMKDPRDRINSVMRDSTSLSKSEDLQALGQQLKESAAGLNVIGRHVKPDNSKGASELSQSEYESFATFMRKRYETKIDKSDIPVLEQGEDRVDSNRQQVALKWLSTYAKRQMDDSVDDDPFADLMPSELSPSRLVNRKQAKRLPLELLHHNNVPLLNRYLTPTGQIRNRMQTRLGARDQRKVSKLVKRARNLGLIPYSGQHKVETHGWVHEGDLEKDRDWEVELRNRGLEIKEESE